MKLRDLLSAPESAPSFRAADLPTINDFFGPTEDFRRSAGGDFGQGAMFKASMADMFGSDEDVFNAIKKNVPGAELEQDAEGFPVIRMPDGKRYALDKPGVQANEAVATAGRVGMFAPVGRAISAIGSLPARLLAAGAGGAGVDAGQQALAGRENADVQQSVVAGLFGAGGEALAPVFGAAARKVKDWFTSDASRIKFGQEVARQLGQEVDDATALEIGKRAAQVRGGAMSPRQAADEAEFGYNLSEGQRTGNFRQLSREERLRQDPGVAGSIMRDADASNTAKVGENLRSILGRMTGGNAPQSLAEAAEAVATGVRGQYRKAKQGIKDAYGALQGKNVGVEARFAQELPGRISKALEGVDVHQTVTPATMRALAQVDDLVRGRASFEDVRRRINSLMPGKGQPADRRAVTQIKGALDGWLDDAVEQALVTGDEAAIEALKKARGMNAAMQRRFAPNDPDDAAGKMVQRLVREGRSPEELATMLWGASQISKTATSTVAARLKAALGNDKAAWDQFRGAVLLQATTRKTGETLGPQAVVANLKQLVQQRPTLLKELYSPEEVARLQRFTQATDAIVRKGDFAKSSGTAERALRYLNDVASPVPGFSTLMRVFTAPAQIAGAYRATRGSGMRTPALPFAAGAAAGPELQR